MARKLKELSDRKAGLGRPTFQFSISSILILMLVVAVAIQAVREIHFRLGPAVAAVFVLTVVSIFLHVAGAILGGRLRSSEEVVDEEDSEDEDEITSRMVQPLQAEQGDFAPATQLSKQAPLKRQPVYYAIGFGAAFFAIVASIVLVWFMWDHLAIINVLFGAVSAAVIGGLFGFLASSFYQVVRSALDEAKKDAS